MKRNLIIIALICAIVVHSLVFWIPNSMLEGYFTVIKPMLWLIIFCFTYFLFYKDERYYQDKKNIALISSLGIIIYLFALFISGIFLNYSYNPFDFSLRGFTINCWTYLPIIVVREYVRSKIMMATHKKHKYWVLLVVSIVFTFLCIDNIKSVVTLSLASKADYLLTTLLPLFFLNLFLTFSAMNGAMGSNIIFMFIYAGIPVYSPVLPNTPKIYEAIILYSTVFIMYILYDKIAWERNKKAKKEIHTTRYNWQWLVAPAIVLTISILFAIGVFPYIPFAVASNSMKSEFDVGYVVLVRKTTPEVLATIEVGQVIQFRKENITIAHRIIEITSNPQGERLFITKGDNNDILDAFPIRESQVIGVVKYKIPYIGWPSVFLSSLR